MIDQEALTRLIRTEPFVPVVVTLTTGDRIELVDPHSVVPMKREFFVALPKQGWRIVYYMHVVSIETMAAA